MTPIRLLPAVLAGLVSAWFPPPAAVAQDPPPNILLILTDDQGFGDIGSHGNPWVKTPHLDRLAAEGARFDRFFVEPVCAPTRAALLSGRYPTRTGVHGVTRGQENMRGEEVTLAELLRDEAGYATACFGKWHNGAQWPYHPNAQGFDTFVGFCGGHWNDYYDPVLERNGESFQARGFIADVLTDKAMAFMESRVDAGREDGAFFCYLPYNTPHTPSSVKPDDWERWADHPEVTDDFTRAMYALCENLDHNIGRLLAKLDELEIADNTIVVFLTDNGANGERFNAGMRGYKGSEHEGGVRVPLFVRWPGRIAPGTVVKPNVAHIDLLPTLCALAGIENPGDRTLPLDGIDLSPLLLGDPDFQMPERNHYTWRNPRRWSVRSDRYRATEKTLHDLDVDPGQELNLAEVKPEIHRALVEDYLAWEAGAVPPSPSPLPVHLGHPEWPTVTLKAHEFELSPGAGRGIDYCAPQGYANQWIENWTDLDASAACPVRIVSGGRYQVTFRYACPPESTGSRFALEAGDARLDFAITEPWISAPYPASEQGPKAPNGYLSREWKEVVVGEIELEAGDFPLQLRALERVGGSMPDFKAVILEKL